MGLGLGARRADAAALRVCYNNLAVDTADVWLYIGGTKSSDVFPGQTQLDGSICGTVTPLPAGVVRGTTQSATVRASNSLAEEGPASNAITFRYPTVPGPPTLVSVSVLP